MDFLFVGGLQFEISVHALLKYDFILVNFDHLAVLFAEQYMIIFECHLVLSNCRYAKERLFCLMFNSCVVDHVRLKFQEFVIASYL